MIQKKASDTREAIQEVNNGMTLMLCGLELSGIPGKIPGKMVK